MRLSYGCVCLVKKMRALDWPLVIVCLLLGGAALIAWPFAVHASIMGLVSPVSEGMPITRTVGVYFFHVGILCYPIVYIACLILSITRLVVKKPYAVLYALLPIFYICFVIVFSILLLTQNAIPRLRLC